MIDDPNHLVQSILSRAHLCAMSILQPDLARATVVQKCAVLAAIDHFRGYVEGPDEEARTQSDLPTYLRAMIHAQDDPGTISLLCQYSEYLQFFLVYAQQRLHRPGSSEDN